MVPILSMQHNTRQTLASTTRMMCQLTGRIAPLHHTRRSHLRPVSVLESCITRSKRDKMVITPLQEPMSRVPLMVVHTHCQLRLLIPHKTHPRPPCTINLCLFQEPQTLTLHSYRTKDTSTRITGLCLQRALLFRLSLKHQASVKRASRNTSITAMSSKPK